MKRETLVFVGTYTEPAYKGKGEGIYSFKMSLKTGALEPLGKTSAKNPAYLALDPEARHLYCVNELRDYAGQASGAVSVFSIKRGARDRGALSLELLNSRASMGSDPCHIVVDAASSLALVSNYSSGSLCVLPIASDGSLEEASQLIEHEGQPLDPAQNPERQAGPHAHSLFLDPDRRYAFACDLGLDRLLAYRYDGRAEVPMSPVPGLDFSTEPGAGPRHCAFHPSGKYCYLIDELSSSIEVLGYRPEEGRLVRLQSVSALPEEAAPFAGARVENTGARVENTCAAIRVSPDGNFLYASNRGHDSIGLWRIDEATGRLAYVECVSCGGRGPRDFVIDPSGSFLIVANQASDNIAVFRVDAESGRLSKVCEAATPCPVCVAACSG
jgi:6-phosphogluconolactonase